MDKNLLLDIDNKDKLLEVTKALGNSLRLDIIKLLSEGPLSINEIAKTLNIPLTTASSSVAVLENAGLISGLLQAGKRGTMKLCSIVNEQIVINFLTYSVNDKRTYERINIPIGSYFSFDVTPTCGLIDENGFIDQDDNVRSFYNPNRVSAQLLWFYSGYVEYRIPKKNKKIKKFEMSAEICSEAPFYRNEWPSDITLVINNREIGTIIVPGDFGGRKGKFTPSWWPINSTQYGLLKKWQIDETSSTIDYQLLSKVNVNQLFNINDPYISIKIGVKNTAKNVGGINIFGEKFGDYPQGIIVDIEYED